MIIVDRRKNGKYKSVPNRRRFIDRYKKNIKKSVDSIARKRKIKDIIKDGEVTINEHDISEPSFDYDPYTGSKDIVLPGNKEYKRGDTIQKPPSGKNRGTLGSPTGQGEDNFTFTLTKDEFFDIYFSDMALPNFIKDNLKHSILERKKRGGYSKEGIFARLDIKKTFEQAIGRRIVTKGKKPRYLDDIDLRYKYFITEKIPSKYALMFCIMDVSGSMEQLEKDLAKKFFLLLYLFLHKEYEYVDIRFIKHAHLAAEVSEEDFFYSRETGGTIVSTALELVNEIINNEVDLNTTNIYIAQASDGDNWTGDTETCLNILEKKLLAKVQYYAYIQTESEVRFTHKRELNQPDLYVDFLPLSEKYEQFNIGLVHEDKHVYPILKELFKK